MGNAYVGIDPMTNRYIVYDNVCNDENKGLYRGPYLVYHCNVSHRIRNRTRV
jgi:hypothetical protein